MKKNSIHDNPSYNKSFSPINPKQYNEIHNSLKINSIFNHVKHKRKESNRLIPFVLRVDEASPQEYLKL